MQLTPQGISTSISWNSFANYPKQ